MANGGKRGREGWKASPLNWTISLSNRKFLNSQKSKVHGRNRNHRLLMLAMNGQIQLLALIVPYHPRGHLTDHLRRESEKNEGKDVVARY